MKKGLPSTRVRKQKQTDSALRGTLGKSAAMTHFNKSLGCSGPLKPVKGKLERNPVPNKNLSKNSKTMIPFKESLLKSQKIHNEKKPHKNQYASGTREGLKALVPPKSGTHHFNSGPLPERRKRMIYDKVDLTTEPWNLKRSPRLKLLLVRVNEIKEGFNPFFKFRRIFKRTKIKNCNVYNRCMKVLNGGLIYTDQTIGIKLTGHIRKVSHLTKRSLEILLSRLPFWASSYTCSQIHDLVRMCSSTYL